MRISVALCNPELALVRVEPSWLERILLGRKAIDDLVTAAPSIGGTTIWIWDSTGRQVDNRRVLDALEGAR